MNKKVIIGSSILLGSIALFFLGRGIVKKIKRGSSSGGGVSGSGTSSTTQSYDPKNDLKSLEGYILGANLMYYPKEVQTVFNSLDDSKLKVLANAWNSKHKESLWASLDDEVDSCGFFSNCYDAPMKRLKSLGL
jgi:hypothetical protein